MKLSILLSGLFLTEALAFPLSFFGTRTSARPTVDQAAVQARRLVHNQRFGQLNTVYQSGELAGSAIGLLEYYADCGDDGSLTLLMVEVGPSYRNWDEGSKVSMSIASEKFTFSRASLPRLSLQGSLNYLNETEEAAKCFLHRHPDARAWVPGNKVHNTAYVKFEVENVYWLGGFGNVAYIGDIPVDMYKNVTLKHGHHWKEEKGDEDEVVPKSMSAGQVRFEGVKELKVKAKKMKCKGKKARKYHENHKNHDESDSDDE
ncbi:pyridoxamine 5'-phosphate oxidase-domain-containing protein [Lipomyces arxii]|uniref:pyridoxamine 5'-phosphate oxidase-domain-containing protein n=1 Tax=Lipomyces arxii TaxID=56418 RepID=UPI0034CF8096